MCVHVCVECVTDGVGWFLGSRCSGCINGSKREKLLHQIQGQSISNHLLSTGMLLRMQSWGINNKQGNSKCVCELYSANCFFEANCKCTLTAVELGNIKSHFGHKTPAKITVVL